MTLTSTYTILLACLVGHIIITYAQHLKNLVQEINAIKEKGDTPLTSTSVTCLILSLLVELSSTVFIVKMLSGTFDIQPSIWALVLFVGMYVVRNILAYLVVWLYWSLIVKLGKKKVKQELLEEIGED